METVIEPRRMAQAFRIAVGLHPDLDITGAEEGVVYVTNTDAGITLRIESSTIEDSPLDQLLKVLTLKREAMPLHQMTRIVGYYSRVQVWNKSKLGELADRHKGNYTLPEQERKEVA